MDRAVSPIPAAPNDRPPLDRGGLMHLAIVVLSGSTAFLAIHQAVGPTGGFPPLWLGALRCGVAATVLALWMLVSQPRVAMPRTALLGIVVSGAFLWGGGNGLASIASQTVSSGIVALFFASRSWWTTLLNCALERRWMRAREALALGLGTAGLALLSLPGAGAIPSDPWVIAALLGSPLCFAIAVCILQRTGGGIGGVRTATWQMIGGAVVLALLSFLAGEPAAAPTATGWAAWAWLTFAGAVFAFPSFAIALQRLPTNVFLAHTWVSPMLAALLGVVVLGEAWSGTLAVAVVLVVAALLVAVLPSWRCAVIDRST